MAGLEAPPGLGEPFAETAPIDCRYPAWLARAGSARWQSATLRVACPGRLEVLSDHEPAGVGAVFICRILVAGLYTGLVARQISEEESPLVLAPLEGGWISSPGPWPEGIDGTSHDHADQTVDLERSLRLSRPRSRSGEEIDGADSSAARPPLSLSIPRVRPRPKAGNRAS